MKKYFIEFNCCTGSIAVEKSLHSYIQDHYDDVVVSAENVALVVKDLERFVSVFCAGKKGCKPVDVRLLENKCTGGYTIQAGSLYVTLKPIKREILNAALNAADVHLEMTPEQWRKLEEAVLNGEAEGPIEVTSGPEGVTYHYAGREVIIKNN